MLYTILRKMKKKARKALLSYKKMLILHADYYQAAPKRLQNVCV